MPHSVYIHIPFCRKRCSYCDFNTYAGIEALLPAYVDALCQEIVKVTSANSSRTPVHTIFLGGGTPSLLSADQMNHLLTTVRSCFQMTADAEISIEANPGTIVDNQLDDFRKLGVNRISFGSQSARESELKLLGRIHTHEETIKSIQAARHVGFENINIDLIFNLPGQTAQDWQQNLNAALALNPDHLSLYSLTIEEGTLLQQQIEDGLYPHPDDDHAADLMDIAVKMLGEAGFIHYEISNWARPGKECLHNKQYWKNRPYFGFGAGAHGLVNNVRTVNELLPRKYINRCNYDEVSQYPLGPAVTEYHHRELNEQIEDHLILNLRLLQEGLNLNDFELRFDKKLDEVYPALLSGLIKHGLLEWHQNRRSLRIPEKHFFIANQILVQFIEDED
ncbi:MAG: radical SAM family heme chaperone HemW [Anaerolineae bacterium]|nr:radical SAM family heme chaperone HemW [Anaerolineae bacterium]